MTKYIRRLGTPLALGAVLAVSACTVKENKSDTTLAADSALNRDLQLANKDTTLFPAFSTNLVPTLMAETEKFFDSVAVVKKGTFQDLFLVRLP